MTIHSNEHPLAGQTLVVSGGKFAGQRYELEDWWDRVSGQSWKFARGNPACLEYAMRAGTERKPNDDQVVYGKIDGLGKLMHISDLAEEVAA